MQQEQQLRLDITQTTPISCECGGKVFHEVMMLRKASRFLHPSLPADQVVPVGVVVCIKCEKIQEDLLPPSLKVMLDKEKDYLEFEEVNQK